MTILHGFELIETRDLAEMDSRARLYRHVRTGAELLSIENSDENKSFGITFKTPINDETGLPHIMEHSVLCGSRKYPIKEPFVELLKTSLNTFLNAMTFDDMTAYPVASQNLQDFYNLIDVYLDAVFYPLIPEETLKQEGWHYEIDPETQQIIYKGVVFNEMKASYSSPDRVLGELSQREVLPDTPYAYNAGGNPVSIPDLDYASFKKYHDTYYHPSNARIFFYGDDDAEARLKLINDFIAEFEALPVNVEFPRQERFDKPRSFRTGYDAGEADTEESKTMMTVNWLMADVTDQDEILSLEILTHILLATPASPLRKALLDSGLGEDLTGDGLDTYKRESIFSVGLKGIQSSDAEKVESLIMETLSTLADQGIDKATIDASLNTIEFRMREKNTGQFPRGLMAMIQALPAWIHGGSPIDSLAFEAPLEGIKQRYADMPNYFEDLIGSYFLNNLHRATVIMEPDPRVGPAREQAEQDRLRRYQETLDESALAKIRQETEALQALQEAPDDPADLARIPTLRLSDLDPHIKTTPTEISEAHGTTILYHDLGTSGITYMDLGLDLHQLPQTYLPYVSLFGKALLEMGTTRQDYVQLSQRIGSQTGGIRADSFIFMNMDRSQSVGYLFLRGKAMASQSGELLAIMRDILLDLKLDHQERFRQMVLEEKAGHEAYLGVGGQAAVSMRLRAHFDTAGWASEQMDGLTNLFFLRDLAKRIDADWASVLADLEVVRQYLVNRSAMIVNVTLDAENWQTVQPALLSFLDDLPTASGNRPVWERSSLPDAEGFTLPAQVNFVGKAANLYDVGYKQHGSNVVITKFLNMTHMWSRIRVQGGAYGGRMSFDQTSGIASFLSWRDPNLIGTLANYDAAANFLKDLQLGPDELEKAIIGAIGQMDRYLLPDARGYSALIRHLIGYTDEARQKNRDEVLGTTLADFHALGAVLEAANAVGKVAAVGSPEALRKASETRPFTITNVL